MEDNSSYIATAGIYGNHSYARNGKVMLCSVIFLFVFVFLMVFLHTFGRWWFFRRRHRIRRLLPFSRPSTNDYDATTTVPRRGLDPSVLKTLPTFLYPATITTTQVMAVPECAVCLSEFEASERGRLLPNCRHAFHVQCIDTWFQSHYDCPLCRTPVKPCIPVQPPKISAEATVIVSERAASASKSDTVPVIEDQMGCSQVYQTRSVELLPVWCQMKPLEQLQVGVTVQESH